MKYDSLWNAAGYVWFTVGVLKIIDYLLSTPAPTDYKMSLFILICGLVCWIVHTIKYEI